MAREFEKKMAQGTVTASSRDAQSNYSKQLMLDAIAGECGRSCAKSSSLSFNNPLREKDNSSRSQCSLQRSKAACFLRNTLLKSFNTACGWGDS
jgi:hypothetical protein